MAEAQQADSVEDLIKKIDEFEKTILGLLENVRKFRLKVAENESRYGRDISKWPNK